MDDFVIFRIVFQESEVESQNEESRLTSPYDSAQRSSAPPRVRGNMVISDVKYTLRCQYHVKDIWFCDSSTPKMSAYM